MIATQYEFMPTMLQSPAYDCSAVMPPGQAWADKYGVKQTTFGTYSVVFGIITEILYIPCTIGLRKDLGTSCFKIMFWLSIMDMIAIMANCILFGVLLLKGAVYCSDPAMTLGVGIVGYGIWFTASSCCLVLGVNRLFEMLGWSRFFSSTRTNFYLSLCCAYGLFATFFTRPVIVNSTLQSMFFSPFIPGHSMDEYVNWPHAVHNIVVASGSCLLYFLLITVLMVKSKKIVADGTGSRVISNWPVFIQVVLICGVNLIAASIYVYMNFVAAPEALIVIGQMCWQFIHGLPPFIYLALNKTIRRIALRAVGFGQRETTTVISSTHGTTASRRVHNVSN